MRKNMFYREHHNIEDTDSDLASPIKNQQLPREYSTSPTKADTNLFKLTKVKNTYNEDEIKNRNSSLSMKKARRKSFNLNYGKEN